MRRCLTACAARRSIQQCEQYDVLELVSSSSSSSSSSSGGQPQEPLTEYVQVVQGWDGSSAVVLRRGQLLRLEGAGDDPAALLPSPVGEQQSGWAATSAVGLSAAKDLHEADLLRDPAF
jgi:hypothetical protein